MNIKNFSRAQFLVCLFLFTCDYAHSQGVSNASISPPDTLISTPTTFTFTANVSGNITPTNALVKDSILLFETTAEGKLLAQVGNMYDDGSRGDATANDGIYTAQVNINETSPLIRYYRVSAAYSGLRNRYLGDTISMKIFPPLPDEIVSQMSSALRSIKNHFNTNLISLGITGAQSIALAEALADPNIGPGNASLSESEISVYYTHIDPATSFKFKIMGIVFVSDPAYQIAGSGLSTPVNIPADVKLPGNDKLLIYAPYYNTQGYGDASDTAQTKFGARQFMEFVPNPPVIMSDANASVELVKTWGDYGTVIVETHGGFWDVPSPDSFGKYSNPTVVLSTGNYQSAGISLPPGSNVPVSTRNADLTANRLALSDEGYFFITPLFIDAYVKPMKNTFLYLGACHSLQNNSMWDVLKKKGAKLAFGFDHSIAIGFVGYSLDRLLEPMLPTSGTANPKNAKEAYDAIVFKQDLNVYPPATVGGTLLMRTASPEWEKFEFVNVLKPITLTVSGTVPGYTIPAEITLSNFYPVSAINFDIFGTLGNTCGFGERGIPIFSHQVDAFADFFGAPTVLGVPYRTSGPFINAKPCSSFYANKRDEAGRGKVWINATGRARQFGGVVPLDWEYQVRYYSGDPALNYSDKSCTLGVVPNSGTYVGSPVTCNVACDNNLFGTLTANTPACN